MTTEEIPEKNLLTCWRKKAVSVTWKVALAASCIIDGIVILALAYLGLSGLWSVMAGPALAVIEAGISVLFGIPWYVYAFVFFVLAIFGYSFLWRIARELTDEDWKSKEANAFAFALATLALAFAIALALAVDPVDHITVWYYVFRFPGRGCTTKSA
jgi:hypothetical protein